MHILQEVESTLLGVYFRWHPKGLIDRLLTEPAVLKTPRSLIEILTGSSFMEISSKHHHSQTVRARELTFWEKVHLSPPVTCHVLNVTCHMSHVTCHMSLVVSHYIYIYFCCKSIPSLNIIIKQLYWYMRLDQLGSWLPQVDIFLLLYLLKNIGGLLFLLFSSIKDIIIWWKLIGYYHNEYRIWTGFPVP